MASLVAQTVKHVPAMRETRVRFLGWADPLEKEMAIHSSTLAWKIPWTDEPDRLQSMVAKSWTQLSKLNYKSFFFSPLENCVRFRVWVQSLGWEDPLEKEMAIHSRTIAWKIPWTEEPGRLQSTGSQRVRHD